MIFVLTCTLQYTTAQDYLMLSILTRPLQKADVSYYHSDARKTRAYVITDRRHFTSLIFRNGGSA